MIAIFVQLSYDEKSNWKAAKFKLYTIITQEHLTKCRPISFEIKGIHQYR